MVMSIVLYACETCILTADIERIQAMKMRCFPNSSISRTEITQLTRKWKTELKTPSNRVKTSELQWQDINWGGTGTSHDHLGWSKLSCREQFKEGDEEADRETTGRQHSREWSCPWMEHHTEESWEPRGVEEVVNSPVVPQGSAWLRDKWSEVKTSVNKTLYRLMCLTRFVYRLLNALATRKVYPRDWADKTIFYV